MEEQWLPDPWKERVFAGVGLDVGDERHEEVVVGHGNGNGNCYGGDGEENQAERVKCIFLNSIAFPLHWSGMAIDSDSYQFYWLIN